jgi:FecR protein
METATKIFWFFRLCGLLRRHLRMRVEKLIAPRRQERKENIFYLSKLGGLCAFARKFFLRVLRALRGESCLKNFACGPAALRLRSESSSTINPEEPIFLQARGRREALTRSLFALLIAATFTLLTASPAQAQTRQEQAELKNVVGEVEVLRRGTTTWLKAKDGMLLDAGDEVRAAKDSGAELVMGDGSVVMVFARSRLQIRQLTTDGTTRTSFFHLVVGIVRYIVAKPAVTLVGTRQNVFSISTPTAVMAARGTDGILSYFPSQK